MHKIRKLYHKKYLILFALCLCVWAAKLSAQTLAPGGPGKDTYWATAAKQGIGTSASLESKVWFTLADGVMTEVYYPDVTTANVHMLQFVVVNPKTKRVETEREDTIHEIQSLGMSRNEKIVHLPSTTSIAGVALSEGYRGESFPASLSFRQTNRSKSGSWIISKTYITDPGSDSVLISVGFSSKDKDDQLYVYYDPSLGNTGMKDSGWSEGRSFVSVDGQIASALTCGRCSFGDATNGFFGVNDGLTQLQKIHAIDHPFSRAENGNLVQMAKVTRVSVGGGPMLFALGFGKTATEAVNAAQSSLTKGFEKTYQEYQKGWFDYLKTLPKVDPKYKAQFNMAAMVLKAQEDKTVRGANVASLTIPWGGGANANEDVGGGYHLVWSRDLYHVFTAYMALGDMAAANRALDFLFNIQQKPDGSFPQNSWLDGKRGWGSLQMDEVGYPLIMAYQLGRYDKATYEKHVKPAADFIVKNGPVTPQERWEEKPGYSPSTIAAEIAGLVCAADIAKRNRDQARADLYLKTADDWQANIEKWTATTNGPFGDGHYYLRLTQHGKPDAGEKMELSNSSGSFSENEIVDAGFLELVRLGIKRPDDPLIARSVKVVDEQLKISTPNGESFYRYNHDGYGEMDDGRRWNWDGKYTGKGRLWALLAGERGQYELAQYASAKAKEFNPPTGRSNYKAELQHSGLLLSHAQSRLDAMLGFANEGMMIPEQVWDKKEVPTNREREFVPELKFGEGTGSATPLAWSMAQFIRLAMSLKAGKNLDTPQVVYDRYVKNSSQLAVVSSQNADLIVNSSEFPVDGPYDDCDVDKQAYWNERNSINFPLIRKCADGSFLASFAYSGDAKNVQITGDFSGWKPYGSFNEPKPPPERSKFNKSRYISLEFKPTARVEYKLIVDGKWITDPLNPNKIDNGLGGENSFFTMPDYKPTEWDKGSEMTGKLEILDVNSKVWNEPRKIQVYVPQVQGNVRQSLKVANPMYPVLYIQDGSDYMNRAKAIQIQENLVKARKVSPFIMVFLDPKDRNKEYWANDNYAKFLATEVVPVIDAKYRTYPYPEFRGVMGASLGGVTSIWTAMKYPEVFGRVGGQSSSFWIDDGRVVKEMEKLDFLKTKLKFYLDDGTLEGSADSETVVKILRDNHYDVVYYKAEAGHNWTAWRDRLPNAFIALFGIKILPR